VALFASAILMTRSDTGNEPSSTAAGIKEMRAVSVTGDALPQFGEGEDAAVGRQVPVVRGRSFDGRSVAIANDGRPKVVLLLAHWCSHCQAEVPVVQDWIDTDGMPEGVDFYSIATSTDSGQPNYPPSQWLEREGWTIPVIADSNEYAASEAFGLTAFPFFVFVDSNGTVSERVSGRQTAAEIAQAISVLS
jgi:thiol-disulfide isomerase/thioredoxin